MLRTRVLTALLLVPLALLAIFGLEPKAFALGAALLYLVGSWEFHRLAGLPALPWGGVLETLQGALFVVLIVYWTDWTASPVSPFALACAAWGLMFLQLARYRPGVPHGRAFQAAGFMNALVAITTGWAALAWLRAEPSGQWWVFLMLLTIWAADIGAYFTGRAIGGARLAPNISPGKTWAGFWGGLASAAVIAVAAGVFLPGVEAAIWQFAVLGAVTAVASVGGDLFISMHKRTVGLKDTGRIFPGHGGLLDRIDSLLAGAPFFVLVKLLMGA